MNNVLYLCDKKGCYGLTECPGEGYCEHTTDIEHAVNFEKRDAGHAGVQFWEKKEDQTQHEVLVVRPKCVMKNTDLNELHRTLCDMRKSGVIILPYYVEHITTIGYSTDIMIKEE